MRMLSYTRPRHAVRPADHLTLRACLQDCREILHFGMQKHGCDAAGGHSLMRAEMVSEQAELHSEAAAEWH